jgi:Tfp pilus assembly protein PilF
MSTVIVSLQDLALNADKSIDLLAMPEAEAIALIKQSFRFLSSGIGISIRDGMAIFDFPAAPVTHAENAVKWYERGVKHAESGDYQEAIRLFKRTLEILPDHIGSRRNLAMAYLAAGNKDKARDHLIEVLALDPKDVWSLVLLGNIHMKHDKNLDQAEKFYRRAFELDPNDAILLTNYGALMLEKGYPEQAIEFFERAIKAHPSYPNSYYAIAVIRLKNNQPDLALAQLDNLFEKAKPLDSRSAQLHSDARKLYLEVNQHIAEQTSPRALDFVEQRRKELAEQTGYRIQMREDNSLESIFAVTQMGWKYGRDYHLIRYRNLGQAVNPHHLMHEMEHVQLEHEARQAGKNRRFVSTQQTRGRAIRSIGDWIYKMRDGGYPEENLTQVTNKLVDGLVNQLFNTPLDMMIERRVFEKYETTRPSQFVSLWMSCAEGLKAFANKDVKRFTPPIFIKLLTRSIAPTLFLSIRFTTVKPNMRARMQPHT